MDPPTPRRPRGAVTIVAMTAAPEHRKSEEPAAQPVTIRPERTHLLVCAVMTLIMLIPISSAPLALGWTLLVPAGYLWWILKAATEVDGQGIRARYAFARPRTSTWSEVTGVSFEKSKALANLKDGASFRLPAVSFNDLPALSTASGGRITDVLSAARRDIDDMVTITRPDGTSRLVTREEFNALVDAGKVRPMPHHEA